MVYLAQGSVDTDDPRPPVLVPPVWLQVLHLQFPTLQLLTFYMWLLKGWLCILAGVVI
jgi:hypothetical protein